MLSLSIKNCPSYAHETVTELRCSTEPNGNDMLFNMILHRKCGEKSISHKDSWRDDPNGSGPGRFANDLCIAKEKRKENERECIL